MDNEAALVRRPIAVSDFLFEKRVDPVELLAGATELVFGAAPRYGSELAATRVASGASAAARDRAERAKQALDAKMQKEQSFGQLANRLPCTTEEVRACCSDLRVLGPREFRTLLRWRDAARKQSGWDAAGGRFRTDEDSDEEEEEEEQSDASGDSEAEESSEESDDGDGADGSGSSDEEAGSYDGAADAMAAGLAKEAKAELKKKKKQQEKARLRAMRRRALNAKVDSTSIDWQEDEGVLSVMKLREMVEEERRARKAERDSAKAKKGGSADDSDNDDDEILAVGTGADGKLPEHMRKAEAALKHANADHSGESDD